MILFYSYNFTIIILSFSANYIVFYLNILSLYTNYMIIRQIILYSCLIRWYFINLSLNINIPLIRLAFIKLRRKAPQRGYDPLPWQPPKPDGPRNHSETKHSRKNYRRDGWVAAKKLAANY